MWTGSWPLHQVGVEGAPATPRARQQAMMETFRTYTEIDPYGRLHLSAPPRSRLHVRRILAKRPDIPKSKVHVESSALVEASVPKTDGGG